jgi:hypothetical protein
MDILGFSLHVKHSMVEILINQHSFDSLKPICSISKSSLGEIESVKI